MNEKMDKLRELGNVLDQLDRDNSAILSKEPKIARPLREARDEAKRRYEEVSEQPDLSDFMKPDPSAHLGAECD